MPRSPATPAASRRPLSPRRIWIGRRTSPMRRANGWQLVDKASRKALRFANYAYRFALSGGKTENCIEPLPQDHRFVGDDWQKWPYNFIYQGFLLAAAMVAQRDHRRARRLQTARADDRVHRPAAARHGRAVELSRHQSRNPAADRRHGRPQFRHAAGRTFSRISSARSAASGRSARKISSSAATSR